MPAVTPVYKTGAAKADIMDTRPGLVMDGYAYPQQKSTGVVDVPLFARAFVIEETRTAATRRLCLVVIDAWSVAEPLKTLVLQNLPVGIRNKFNRGNLVVSATHTHCGPGGYAHYFLYNLTTGGHDTTVRDKMVTGIVQAIAQACANLQPGHVYVTQGDLTGCGDNRSVAAYRANPEGQAVDAFAKRTDTEMTLLRFTQDAGTIENEIGLYSLFAIHPTNMGMFNVEISGDNKGWAAKRCEDVKPAGYVAAFANANAGDVSPNVTVAANWQTTFTVPLGGPGDAAALAANKFAMKAIGQKQADKALVLAAGPMTELIGRIDHRATHIDLSNVSVGGKRTAKSAVGVSFAAGSHEDSIGLATFAVLGFNFDIKPEISEGMNIANYSAGKVAAKALVGSFITNIIADASGLAGVLGAAGLITASGKLDGIRASAPARSWTFGNFARALFPGEAGSHDPQKTGPVTNPTSWQWIIRNQNNWPTSYVAGQGVKPIVFPVGITELRKHRGANTAIVDAPLVPHVVPLQVAAIGSLVLAIVPSEFTTVAGRRLKAKVKSVMGMAASHVGLVGYANDYAFYVTTPEEYDKQHYEGASTLYGPNTLAAYLQEMGKLATALKSGTAVTVGGPVAPPAIFYKQ
jgi:Neutral/alkaline non-lysosomal ceramidase, N-terminal